MQRVMDAFANPVKSNLLLEVMRLKKATARQLQEAFPNIAQATLYRYLKRLVDAGILKVVASNKKRGAQERVYAVDDSYFKQGERLLEENPGEGYMLLFNQYMTSLSNEFYEHTRNNKIDLKTEMSGFWLRPVCATPAEIQKALLQVSELLQPLSDQKPAPGRSMHSIGLILTPPKDPEKPKEEPET